MPNHRPLVYYWIAKHNDGTTLPQFNPKTGKENKFSQIHHKKLINFGWHPFTPTLAKKIQKAEGITATPTLNKPHTITIKNGQKLVAHRTCTIKLNTPNNETQRSETIYVLGIKNKKITQINEQGKEIK